tara:strand:+ start:4450 stop:6885 length:2436 start_codon:yes stop_codon:yes gene_type:complete
MADANAIRLLGRDAEPVPFEELVPLADANPIREWISRTYGNYKDSVQAQAAEDRATIRALEERRREPTGLSTESALIQQAIERKNAEEAAAQAAQTDSQVVNNLIAESIGGNNRVTGERLAEGVSESSAIKWLRNNLSNEIFTTNPETTVSDVAGDIGEAGQNALRQLHSFARSMVGGMSPSSIGSGEMQGHEGAYAKIQEMVSQGYKESEIEEFLKIIADAPEVGIVQDALKTTGSIGAFIWNYLDPRTPEELVPYVEKTLDTVMSGEKRTEVLRSLGLWNPDQIAPGAVSERASKGVSRVWEELKDFEIPSLSTIEETAADLGEAASEKFSPAIREGVNIVKDNVPRIVDATGDVLKSIGENAALDVSVPDNRVGIPYRDEIIDAAQTYGKRALDAIYPALAQQPDPRSLREAVETDRNQLSLEDFLGTVKEKVGSVQKWGDSNPVIQNMIETGSDAAETAKDLILEHYANNPDIFPDLTGRTDIAVSPELSTRAVPTAAQIEHSNRQTAVTTHGRGTVTDAIDAGVQAHQKTQAAAEEKAQYRGLLDFIFGQDTGDAFRDAIGYTENFWQAPGTGILSVLQEMGADPYSNMPGMNVFGQIGSAGRLSREKAAIGQLAQQEADIAQLTAEAALAKAGKPVQMNKENSQYAVRYGKLGGVLEVLGDMQSYLSETDQNIAGGIAAGKSLFDKATRLLGIDVGDPGNAKERWQIFTSHLQDYFEDMYGQGVSKKEFAKMEDTISTMSGVGGQAFESEKKLLAQVQQLMNKVSKDRKALYGHLSAQGFEDNLRMMEAHRTYLPTASDIITGGR